MFHRRFLAGWLALTAVAVAVALAGCSPFSIFKPFRVTSGSSTYPTPEAAALAHLTGVPSSNSLIPGSIQLVARVSPDPQSVIFFFTAQQNYNASGVPTVMDIEGTCFAQSTGGGWRVDSSGWGGSLLPQTEPFTLGSSSYSAPTASQPQQTAAASHQAGLAVYGSINDAAIDQIEIVFSDGQTLKQQHLAGQSHYLMVAAGANIQVDRATAFDAQGNVVHQFGTNTSPAAAPATP